MRRAARWLGVAAVAAGLVSTLLPGDRALFPPDAPIGKIVVVDHGWHAGVVVPQALLRRAAFEIGGTDPASAERLRWLASRYPEAPFLEIGWGDAAVYRDTPRIGDLDPARAAAALLWPTPSVLHVVPLHVDADHAFRLSDRVTVPIGLDGLVGMASRLADTIPAAEGRKTLGPGLYGNGGFFAATFDYHLFRTCNHWVSWILRGAGVPSSALAASLSAGLIAELRLRAR